MCECVCCYYFANPSTVSLCLSVHVRPCLYIQSWGAIRVQQAFDVRYNSNTFTQVQYSVNSHKKHTHSLKRWKPGKNVGWYDRQLVIFQTQITASRRTRELDNQLPVILRKQQKTYVYTYTRVCMFVCMIYWGARANQRHTRHHRSSRVCEWSLHVCVLECVLTAAVLHANNCGQTKSRYGHTQ